MSSLVLKTPTNPGKAVFGDASDLLLVELANLPGVPLVSTPVPVDKSYAFYFSMLTTSALNNLPVPTFVGQRVNFVARQPVGGLATRIITATAAFNLAGQTVMTFTAADQFIELEAISADSTGSVLTWRVVSNDGVGLS